MVICVLDKLAVERDKTAGRVEAISIAPDNTVGADVDINVGALVGINVGAEEGISVGDKVEDEDIDHY